MEFDQLVTYSTAKAAKNKGFDLACQHAYLLNIFPTNDAPEKCSKIVKELKTGFEIGIPTGYNNEQLVCIHQTWKNSLHQPQILARPTQTALRKWLLEKHSIFIELKLVWDKDRVGYECSVWKFGTTQPLKGEYITRNFGTYCFEETLEVALHYSLDLIA